ncbi:MAG TPA: hypothetical protein VFV33_21400, partial [Gemmatimonadaceae bacterium]|nr:hypothetical protein [Gemmatimonadaceae bacterium]
MRSIFTLLALALACSAPERSADPASAPPPVEAMVDSMLSGFRRDLPRVSALEGGAGSIDE